MKKITVVAGLVLLSGAFGAATVSAQQAGPCLTGKLVGFDSRSETVPGVHTEHYEERNKNNGKKVIDGYTYDGEQTKETYILTVELGDMVYMAEHVKMLFFGYNPTDMVVNDPVTACVEKNKLVLIRPDGKKYKTTIVRVERKEGEERSGR